MDRSSFSLILSLLAHALVAWLIWLAPKPPAPPSGATEVTYVDPADRTRPTARPRQQYIDRQPEPPKEDVVKEELHDTSSLISNLNRRYKKQMLNRRLGSEKKSNAPGRAPEPKLQNDHLTDRRSPDVTNRPNDGELELPRFGGNPNKQALFAPSSTAMKVPWVDFGDMTVLNSDRNTYYVFYERMGEQVGNRWVSLVREMISRTPRERLDKMSRADRLTRVEIVLDKNGDFKNAHFEQGSGFEDLDYTGVEAFRMATPFVNPPAGMAGRDGLIHIHVAFEIIMRPPVAM